MKKIIDRLMQNLVFYRDSLLFSRFIKDITFNEPEDKTHIGILVTLWPSRTLFFYTLALSLLIQHKRHNLTIIYDDLAENLFPTFAARAQKIMAQLGKNFKDLNIIYLSSIPGVELADSDNQEITNLAEFNSYYQLKTTVPIPESKTEISRLACQLQEPAAKIKNLFNLHAFDTVIIPGGIFGFTGLYRYFGHRKNVRIATFDSGPNKIIIGTNDVAAHLKDIPDMLSGISDFSEYDRAINYAKEELHRRFSGLDHYKYQKVDFDHYTPADEFDIFIPLNIEIDTAAFTYGSNFKNLYNWLDETIQYVLGNTDAIIAIKEHPSKYNRSEHLKIAIAGKYQGEKRLIYYDKDENVNTYKLLLAAKLILPYTSTVGIEAAILGKTVVVESGVYYSKLPFVINANSKKDYFDKITYYLHNEFIITEDKLNYAYLCYYFTQVCNFLLSDFTPQDMDYNKWVRQDFNKLSTNESVNMQLASFVSAIPLALLNNNRISAEN